MFRIYRVNYATCSRRLEIADNKATDIDKSIIVGRDVNGRPVPSTIVQGRKKRESERKVETRGDSSDGK